MSYKRNKILAIIPAKKYSSELKNKNLLKLKNLSLVEIATKVCRKSKLIDYIVISSDSNKIIKRSKLLLERNDGSVSKRDFRRNISNVLYLSAFSISIYIFICVSLIMESYLPASVVETAPYQVLSELSNSFVSVYREQSYGENFKSILLFPS